ncbi:MAG: hypothetical protein QOC94_1683 [Actinoplanes sp.]|nr:hypothetical protein [Actinoplanes sp.]
MARLNLHNVDLNLLVSLHVLLTERSVTKAAEKLSVSQSTMSTSLAKLRRLLNDPILTKNGREMELTPRGTSLTDQVADILDRIETLVAAPRNFDPVTSGRTFTIVADDYVLAVLIGPLLREIEQTAPGISLHILSTQLGQLEPLRNGLCDLAIWPQWLAPARATAFPRTELLTDDFIAVVADDHPAAGDTLTYEQLLELPSVHALNGIHWSDQTAAPSPAPHNILVTTETFTSAAHMLPGTQMYAILQRRLNERLHGMLGLRAVELTSPLPTLSESMYWHPRHTDNAGHRWLRSSLLRLASTLDIGTCR